MESAGAATYPDCVTRGIQCSPRIEFSTKCDPSVKHFLPVVLTRQSTNIPPDLAQARLQQSYSILLTKETTNIYVLEKVYCH